MPDILLIDCNNFFVSCEELFDPSLKGKAVCVLSNNDGCVIARSNQAKDLGITMGMPYFIAKQNYKFKNVIYISGNHSRYSQTSKRIMDKLYDFSPTVEIYSIDEAFIDITGCEKLYKMSSFEIAKKIKNTIKDEIGIDVSIGVAGSKTLAKLASEKAKTLTRKCPGSDAVISINENNRIENLKITPIEDIWGIGPSLFKFMRMHNIRTAHDYTTLEYDFIKRHLGKCGLDMKEELLNHCINPVASGFVMPKSISKTASFKEFTKNKDYIKNTLNYHSHRVCSKLRSLAMTSNHLSIILRTKDFRVMKAKVSLKNPMDSELGLNEKIYELFDSIFIPGIIYRSSGVCVSALMPKQNAQLSMFDAEKRAKSDRLSSAWDKIENKFGAGSLTIGIPKKKEDGHSKNPV